MRQGLFSCEQFSLIDPNIAQGKNLRVFVSFIANDHLTNCSSDTLP